MHLGQSGRQGQKLGLADGFHFFCTNVPGPHSMFTQYAEACQA